jgi:hypothetical protein
MTTLNCIAALRHCCIVTLCCSLITLRTYKHSNKCLIICYYCAVLLTKHMLQELKAEKLQREKAEYDQLSDAQKRKRDLKADKQALKDAKKGPRLKKM